jgi:ATP-dependent Clp protease ATP-binding subunit ClpA
LARAASSGQDYARTEHILLEICGWAECNASRILAHFAIDIRDLANALGKQLQPGLALSTSQQARFTPRASKSLELAIREAKRLKCDLASTEHILLGIVLDGESIAARILFDAGVTYESLRNKVAQTEVRLSLEKEDLPAPHRDAPGGSLPLSPALSRVLERSARLVCRSGQSCLCTEHFVVAMLREKDCVAVRALTRLGVKKTRLERELRIKLGSRPSTHLVAKSFHYSPLIRKALANAGDEAVALSFDAIEIEHVMLGILKSPGSLPSAWLGKLGVDYSAYRREVSQLREVAPRE